MRRKTLFSMNKSMSNRLIKKMIERYGKKEGNNKVALYHHGDCLWHRIKICDCGLLHDADFLPDCISVDLHKLFPTYLSQSSYRYNIIHSLQELITAIKRAQ